MSRRFDRSRRHLIPVGLFFKLRDRLRDDPIQLRVVVFGIVGCQNSSVETALGVWGLMLRFHSGL